MKKLLYLALLAAYAISLELIAKSSDKRHSTVNLTDKTLSIISNDSNTK